MTIVVLMGVAGSGKTTVGQRLARELGWTFVEGDEFHSPENVAKMARGEPLDDADRAPWLAALRRRIDELAASGRSAVVACSALKRSYRDVLAAGRPEVVFVHLDAPADVLAERLRRRTGHYMHASMLASQLAALERPADALVVDARPSPGAVVAAIRHGLGA